MLQLRSRWGASSGCRIVRSTAMPRVPSRPQFLTTTSSLPRWVPIVPHVMKTRTRVVVHARSPSGTRRGAGSKSTSTCPGPCWLWAVPPVSSGGAINPG